ncbi:hypothetical protein F7725_006279 [Dissostichus mawsoni]|uniref:Uncharacterized protein n=1 Tax=Dissostichus mawsoni TaxID=36200 RepID=A0A7J5YTJ6_DISMA|nr:hypothetical protein F7725_006279 [Dissostichus mawsoni]
MASSAARLLCSGLSGRFLSVSASCSTLPGLSVAESPGRENREPDPLSGVREKCGDIERSDRSSRSFHTSSSRGGSQQDLYQVLSDELKRKQYDTYGVAGFNPSGGGGAGQQQYYKAGGSSIDPEELFRKIFGEFSGGRGFGDFNSMFEQRPEFVMELTFSEAAKGAQKPLTVNLDDACPRCDGKGSEPGTKEEAPSSSPSASCAEAPDRPRRGRPSPCPSPQVPASCQADQVIRLQGKGIRRMNSYSYGDHYLHIKIRVEKQADEESTERPGRGRRVLCRLFHTGMNLRRQKGRVKARRNEMDHWPLLTLNRCSLRLSEERTLFHRSHLDFS